MDTHWVGYSVIIPVDAEYFLKRKDIQEVGDKKNDDFDMDILEKGYLEKVLNPKKKNRYGKQPRKTIYEVFQ